MRGICGGGTWRRLEGRGLGLSLRADVDIPPAGRKCHHLSSNADIAARWVEVDGRG
jgi:hypothetical protein